MKILLTGGSGQLGSEVVRVLGQQGHELTVPDRAALDFLSPAAVTRTVEQHRPDWVINCAAYTRVDQAESEQEQAYTANRDTPGCLAGVLAETGGRLLHVSTDFVFDGRQDRPYKESDTPHPLSVYGRSKLEGEQAIQQALPGAVILRTAWLYGVNGHNFVKTMLRLAQAGRPLRVVNDQHGSPTWAADVAGVIGALLNSTAEGVFHYTNAGHTTWYGFACAILEEAAALGFDISTREIEPIPTADYPTPAVRPAFSVLDTGKIASLLSLSIPAWRDSLRRMLEELRTCADCW